MNLVSDLENYSNYLADYFLKNLAPSADKVLVAKAFSLYLQGASVRIANTAEQAEKAREITTNDSNFSASAETTWVCTDGTCESFDGLTELVILIISGGAVLLDDDWGPNNDIIKFLKKPLGGRCSFVRNPFGNGC